MNNLKRPLPSPVSLEGNTSPRVQETTVHKEDPPPTQQHDSCVVCEATRGGAAGAV